MVIASVVFWEITAQSDGDKIPVVLFVTIIVISILSVFVVYFSKIQKKKFEKLLNQEYYEQYEIIKDAVANSQLSAAAKKDISEDVLELLLSAQESGKAIRSVVENSETFARNIIQTFARPSWLAILSLYDSFIAFILMVVGLTLVLWLEQTQQSFFITQMDVSILALFVLTAFILIPVTKAGAGSRNPWIFLVPVAGGGLFVLVTQLLRGFFYDVPTVQKFLDGSVRMVPNSLILAIYLLAIPLFLMLKQISRKRMLRGA
ncbi:MAG: hypothetical protein CVT98_10645 [Bacteroidetes bacterium HGW-Bacteroidetes-15]|nr:MAG: hypothetical protein CVT98_10645 [Bacteroidetes bacterium HGW-Bacteroidetes-15]